MKRRKPMKRSPLAPGRGLQPGKPLPSRKRTPVRQGRSDEDLAAYNLLRQIVWDRAGGRCERCGGSILAGFQCHHRRLRRQGGQDQVVNLVALCPPCHHDEVHGQPERARAEGFIVPGLGAGPRVDPARVPVRLHDGRVVLLDEDGGYDLVFGADGRAA